MPRIRFDELGGEDRNWSTNTSEARVSASGCSSFETEQFRADPGEESDVVRQGFFDAARKCFWVYDQSIFETTGEHLAERGSSKADYAALVSNKLMGL